MSRRLIHYRDRTVRLGSKVDVTETAANIIRNHESGGKYSRPIKEAKAIRLAINLGRIKV